MPDAVAIDLTDPQFRVDPYPLYARLRTQAPVCLARAGFFGRVWLITRYDDVTSALRDERFTKDFRKVRRPEVQLLRLFGPLNRHMLNVDQPDHTRLRYDSPLKLATPRWTLCEVTVNGVKIPRNAGLAIAIAIASANRDPLQFPRPDVLDLAREPNRHLSLGQGIHYCLGAPLARLEAQIAFTTLLRRFPRMRLAVPRDSLRWRNSMPLRGLESLPVAFA